MEHVFIWMCKKLQMSKSSVARIILIVEVALWFVSGGIVGGLFGVITGADVVQMILSFGSGLALICGFGVTLFRFLQVEI